MWYYDDIRDFKHQRVFDNCFSYCLVRFIILHIVTNILWCSIAIWLVLQIDTHTEEVSESVTKFLRPSPMEPSISFSPRGRNLLYIQA